MMRHSAAPSRRRGFTLVEMLVSVALVVLMMTLFASIFEIATGTMSKQKGLAENDQKARRVSTNLMTDIQKRTYRRVVPIRTGLSPAYPSQQQGYFSISENDPTDDTDDVLSFTIVTTNTLKNKDTTPVYGRSVLLASPSGTNYNQPEFDDGNIAPNESMSSSIAEVCYFLRNGVLYRRVMLARQPYVPGKSAPQKYTVDMMGNINGETDAFDGPYNVGMTVGGSGAFWQDFDLVAHNFGGYPAAAASPNTQTPPVVFGTTTLLSNDETTGAAPGALIYSLGMPNMRWGHNVLFSGGQAGAPREYVGTTFIGRFTHEETSHPAFGYPGVWSDAGYPMTNTALTMNARGSVTQYEGGPRRGEDILLTNVHAFDIKVFDDYPGVPGDVNKPAIVNYKDLGYESDGTKALPRGWYARASCANTLYGPWADDSLNNIFDTWHPNFVLDLDNNMIADSVPYRPSLYGADLQPGKAGVDDDMMNGTDDAGEYLFPGSDDYSELTVPPLGSIQITIRYLDPTSQQMRDLTLIESLKD